MTINWGNPEESRARQATPAGPGWYADPNGLPTLRWWDGHTWTDQLAPMQQQAPEPREQIIVTKSPMRTSHGLHLFLTIITCGLWLPVWFLLTITHKFDKEKSVSRVYR